MAFKNLQNWLIIYYLPPKLSKKSNTVWMKKIHQFGPWWYFENLGKNNCTTWISKIHQFNWWFCIFPPNLSKSIQHHKDCKILPIWTIILYFENYTVPYGFQKIIIWTMIFYLPPNLSNIKSGTVQMKKNH